MILPDTNLVRKVDRNFELAKATSLAICPACSKEFYFRKGVVLEAAREIDVTAVPVIAPAVLPDTEKELFREMLETGHGLSLLEEFREFFAEHRGESVRRDGAYDSKTLTNSFACPYCATSIQLTLQLAVTGCVLAQKGSTPKTVRAETVIAQINPLDRASEEDRQLYHSWKQSGLLDLFLKATTIANPSSVPQREDRQVSYIRAWFRTASFCKVPRRTLATVIHDLDTAEVVFYHAQGVVGIVADGELRSFVTKSQAMGYADESLVLKNGKGVIDEIWHKTKFGYAAGRGVFFNALRLESRASTGSATGKQRGTQSPSG